MTEQMKAAKFIGNIWAELLALLFAKVQLTFMDYIGEAQREFICLEAFPWEVLDKAGTFL